MQKNNQIDIKGPEGKSFRTYLENNLLARVFSNEGWPKWFGGILLGLISILYLALALKPFSIYTGYLNWGQHFYVLVLGIRIFGLPSANPLFERTSIGDIGLFLGALLVALLSNEFRIRTPALKVDYLEAIAGGTLMALGTVLASGCNWGGFFSAITALSFHGYLMFIGLIQSLKS